VPLGSSLFGYGAPSSVSYLITGGAAFVGSVVLDNSAPSDVTRFTWSATSTAVVTLQALWSTPIVPRCGVFLGTTLPVGMVVTIKGKRSGDSNFPYLLGGNSQTSVVVQLDDGSRAIIWAFDAGLTPIVGYEIAMYPPSGGVITASELFEIGEARIFQGYRPGRGIQEKWTPGFDNIQAPPTTVNRQKHTVNHRYNHTDSIILGVADELSAYTSDNGDISLNRFAHICAAHQTMLFIPVAYVNGILNTQMLHNTAIYGDASKIERPQYVTNHHYQLALQINEYPPQQYG